MPLAAPMPVRSPAPTGSKSLGGVGQAVQSGGTPMMQNFAPQQSPQYGPNTMNGPPMSQAPANVIPFQGPPMSQAPLAVQYGASPYGQQFNTIYDMYAQMYGPEMAGFQNQGDNFLNQIQQMNAATQQQAGFMQQNAGFDQALLNNSARNLDIQRGALNRQPALINSLYGLDQQGFGLQRQNNDLSRTGNNLDRYSIGLQGQQLGIDRQGYESEANTAMRMLNSQHTARGSWGSKFQRLGLSDIKDAFGRQLDSSYLDESELGLQGQRVDIADQRLGLSDQSIGLDEQRSTLNRDEALAVNRDNLATLDTQAAAYGINAQQLAANLNQGLANLNLSNTININDVLSAISSNDVQRATLARQIMEQALGTFNQSAQTGVWPMLPMPNVSSNGQLTGPR